jgi:hypothetical protein
MPSPGAGVTGIISVAVWTASVLSQTVLSSSAPVRSSYATNCRRA